MAFNFSYSKLSMLLIIFSFVIYNHKSICVLCMSSIFMCITFIGGTVLLFKFIFDHFIKQTLPNNRAWSFNKNSSSSNILQDDFCLSKRPISKNKRVMTDIDVNAMEKSRKRNRKLSNIEDIVASIKELNHSEISQVIKALELPLKDKKVSDPSNDVSKSNASFMSDKDLLDSKQYSVSRSRPSSSKKSSKSKSLSPEKRIKKTVISDYHNIPVPSKDGHSSMPPAVMKAKECSPKIYSNESQMTNVKSIINRQNLLLDPSIKHTSFNDHSSKRFDHRNHLTQLVTKTKFNSIEGVLLRARSLSPDFKPGVLTRVSSTTLFSSKPSRVVRKY